MFLLFSEGQEEILGELQPDQLYLDPAEGWKVMGQLILETLLRHIKKNVSIDLPRKSHSSPT